MLVHLKSEGKMSKSVINYKILSGIDNKLLEIVKVVNLSMFVKNCQNCQSYQNCTSVIWSLKKTPKPNTFGDRWWLKTFECMGGGKWKKRHFCQIYYPFALCRKTAEASKTMVRTSENNMNNIEVREVLNIFWNVFLQQQQKQNMWNIFIKDSLTCTMKESQCILLFFWVCEQCHLVAIFCTILKVWQLALAVEIEWSWLSQSVKIHTTCFV